MIEIKKIGVLSLGKVMGLFYAIIGLLVGAVMTLSSLVAPAFSSIGLGVFGGVFGIGAIIFLPVIYGITGFVSGLILASLYNFVASWVGGIELHTE